MRQFFEKTKVDDLLLKNYLRGRKNDPFHAWDTVRFTHFFQMLIISDNDDAFLVNCNIFK